MIYRVESVDDLPMQVEEMALSSDVLVLCGGDDGIDSAPNWIQCVMDIAGNTPIINATRDNDMALILAHVYTILQQQSRLRVSRHKQITVTLLGDVSKSSLFIRTLGLYSTEIRVIIMAPYIPLSWKLHPPASFQEADSLASVLPQTDVLYILPSPHEGIPSPFALTEEVMALAKQDMIVLFPDSKMKRNLFMELGNDKRLETKQLITDALAIRMAMLYSLLENCNGDHD